jgi:hypothetical protein
MTDGTTPRALEIVAAYLGAHPEELKREWRLAASLGVVAERYGRPLVGLEELLATLTPR